MLTNLTNDEKKCPDFVEKKVSGQFFHQNGQFFFAKKKFFVCCRKKYLAKKLFSRHFPDNFFAKTRKKSVNFLLMRLGRKFRLRQRREGTQPENNLSLGGWHRSIRLSIFFLVKIGFFEKLQKKNKRVSFLK